MSVLKVTTVGNSVGVILPKEILERLRVGKGDSLYVVETKNGIQLTAYDPAVSQQVEIAERVMRGSRCFEEAGGIGRDDSTRLASGGDGHGDPSPRRLDSKANLI